MMENLDELAAHAKIFGIHGGGNIGLGLMADIIGKSGTDYQIVATSNDEFFNRLINSGHQLWLHHNAGNETKTTSIKNVTMISRNTQDIKNLYCHANLLAICLTPDAFNQSAKDIALGIIERYKNNPNKINILVLMNIPKCDQYVKQKIVEELKLLGTSPDLLEKIMTCVKFIPTVVDRIVTKIPAEKVKLELKNQLIDQIKIEKGTNETALTEQVDTILTQPDLLADAIKKYNLHFNLYNAESNFSLAAPKDFTEGKYFPAINLVDNLEELVAVKNKFIKD